MKIVFMGTPEFAVPSLNELIKKYNVVSIFTQPDKPKGRGKKLSISEVKEVALKNNIPVYQPIKLKDDREMIDYLKELKPDFIIVVAFGQLLTKEILDIPKYGCVNLHGSILPMYRGAAPINWAIIKGEKLSGNTTMLMDVGIDTGDMLLKDEVEVPEDMTSGELYDILKERGSKLLVETIEGLVNNKIKGEKQPEETFYAKILDKNIAKIDWTDNALNINNLVRGLNPWPITHTNYKGEKMKIYEASVIDNKEKNAPGLIKEVSKEGIKVSCGQGTLLIKKIQFQNGKPLTIQQYINGNGIDVNEILE